MKKIAILSILFSFTLILSNCGDSKDDPTPTQTELDQIKAKLVGNLTFQSVTVVQGTKQATTSSCSRVELESANFTDTNWKYLAGTMTFALSNTGQGSVNYPCLSGSPIVNGTWAVTEESTGVYRLRFTDPTTTASNKEIIVFEFTKADIDIKNLNLISNGSANSSNLGYVVKYKFS